jgi:hypothetical protein
MILVAASVVVLLSAWLAGGRLRALGELPMRHWWALITAMTIQIAIIEVLSTTIPTWLADSAHIASFVLALFFVAVNRRITGLWLVGLGGFCNGLAIAANGGVMPAASNALRTAGIPLRGAGFRNSAHVAHAKLAFLGDVFAIPKGWPLANVFSVGDVLLVIGAFVLVHTATGSRVAVWRRTPERRTAATDATAGPEDTEADGSAPVAAHPSRRVGWTVRPICDTPPQVRTPAAETTDAFDGECTSNT